MKLYFKLVDSPVGRLKLVASDQGLVAILWEKDRPGRVRLCELVETPDQAILLKTEKQLSEYFSGERERFELPLDMRGTAFQKSVWEALIAIPIW